MRKRDESTAADLETRLQSFAVQVRPLPGIEEPPARAVLVGQLIDSMRRVRFATMLPTMELATARMDPGSHIFDPLRAAVLRARMSDFEEACWLVFLFVHFGKHARTAWRLVRSFYGALGHGKPWTWQRVSRSPKRLRSWMDRNQVMLRDMERVGHFGNHRKYETLSNVSTSGTASVIESYVEWVQAHENHRRLFERALAAADGKQDVAFEFLYRSMTTVRRFGRTARFDYLTMIGKLGLAPIEPGSPYIAGSTGPLHGAQLLIGGTVGTRGIEQRELDRLATELGRYLEVGMQVIEDALCNWQKNPFVMKHFRG